MSYRTGHLPDHSEVIRTRRGMHLFTAFASIMALAASLPMSTTNRANLDASKGGPGVLNQGQTGSCEGHAHASAGTLRLANKGTSKGLLSPVQLYLGALVCDQQVQPDGMLSAITDAGTMPQSIQNAWATFGARLAKDDPQYPADPSTMYQSPSDPNSVLILPKMETLYGDASFRYSGAYFITAQGTQRLLQALSVLASGRTITDAIPASGPEFQGYSSGVLGALSGPVDHANHILDYEWMGTAAQWLQFTTALAQNDTTMATSLATLLVLHCVNSWSVSWGESDPIAGQSGGLYRANITYFNQAEDLCVVDISLAA